MVTKLIPTEDQEQMLFVQWFRRTYRDVRIFAIPNGGARHIAVAAKMKATGVSRGVPDLYIPAWKLWIEMKRVKGGSVSKHQKEWIEYLKTLGDTVYVTKGFDEARQVIIDFVSHQPDVL